FLRYRSGDEADEERRRMEGDRVYLAHGQPRRLVAAVEGHALEERLQDLRARHGRAGRRHAQRGRTLAGSMQEIAASDGRRYAEGTPTGVLQALRHRGTTHADAARVGVVRPYHLAAVRRSE